MKAARRILGAVGVGVAAFGAWLLASDLPFSALFALGVWLAAAIVVHDGLIVPVSLGLRTLVRSRGRRLPPTAVRSIEIGASVGGILTLYAVAELWAQGKGNANPTILTGAYGLRLALVWVVIAAVVGVIVTIAVRRSAVRERDVVIQDQPMTEDRPPAE